MKDRIPWAPPVGVKLSGTIVTSDNKLETCCILQINKNGNTVKVTRKRVEDNR